MAKKAAMPKFNIVVKFDEAIATARSRGIELPYDYYNSIEVSARSRAFTVSGLASVDQIQRVRDSLEASTIEGKTFRQWQDDALANVDELASLPPGRMETIFRTNIQTHYNIGRTIQQRRNIAALPYFLWDAINDSRVRESHALMDNHIAPINDPIWRIWSPPSGFNCRCARISLSETEAVARGYKGGRNPPVGAIPDDGFDYEKADGFDGQLKKAVKKKVDKAKKSGLPKLEEASVLPPIVTNDFIPQKSIPELNRYMMENGIASFVDFGKIDLQVANESARSAFENIRKFPELKNNLEFFGSIQRHFVRRYELQVNNFIKSAMEKNPGISYETASKAAPSYIKKKTVSKDWFGISLSGTKGRTGYDGISINEYHAKDAAEMLKRLQKGVDDKFHPQNSASLRSTADHEFGHQIDNLIGAKDSLEMRKIYIDFLKAVNHGENLAGYALDSIDEFIAEAWAEYAGPGTPRAIAKQVGELIERLYHEKKLTGKLNFSLASIARSIANEDVITDVYSSREYQQAIDERLARDPRVDSMAADE